MAKIKFENKSILTIARQINNAVLKYKKEHPGLSGKDSLWSDDIRSEVIGQCFTHLFAEKCPGSYRGTYLGIRGDVSRSWVRETKDCPLQTIKKRLEAMGLKDEPDSEMERHGVACFKISDSLKMILIPNGSGVYMSTTYMYYYDASANVSNLRLSIEEQEERKNDLADKIADIVTQWREHESEYLAEIDEALRTVQKRSKIAEVSATTSLSIIKMRMQDEGFTFRVRESKTYTDLMVSVGTKEKDKFLFIRVNHARLNEDLERTLNLAHTMRSMIESGQNRFQVKDVRSYDYKEVDD